MKKSNYFRNELFSKSTPIQIDRIGFFRQISFIISKPVPVDELIATTKFDS